jgi:hypothetical protein
MELTDSEREEFTRLANATLDPDLWDEADLPILRAARADYEREQALERRDDDLSVEQTSVKEDDERSDPGDPRRTADDA